MRASSPESVINNYAVFQALWEDAKDIVKDSETCSKHRSASYHDHIHILLWACSRRAHFETHRQFEQYAPESLPTAVEGQEIAELTRQTLQKNIELMNHLINFDRISCS